MDNMDKLLFDVAKEQTEAMRFDAAWSNIQAAHEKKRARQQRRRRMPLTIAASAAVILISVFAGMQMERTGLLYNLFAPPVIIVDPPKTSIDSTSISKTVTDVVRFENLPAQGGDIAAFIPDLTAVPYTLSSQEINYGHHAWYADFAQDVPGEFGMSVRFELAKYIADDQADFEREENFYYLTQNDIIGAKTLLAGEGIACVEVFASDNGAEVLHETVVEWHIAIHDDTLLVASFWGFTLEETQALLKSIPIEKSPLRIQ